MANFDWHAERSDLAGIALLDRAPESEGIDLKAVRLYRLRRVRQEMKCYGVDAVILSDPINIRYATGARNMQVFCQRNAPSRYLLLTADYPSCMSLRAACTLAKAMRPSMKSAPHQLPASSPQDLTLSCGKKYGPKR
jgi:hypothetical protein